MQVTIVNELKNEILNLAEIVRVNFLMSVESLENNDTVLAKDVIDRDEKINMLTDKISESVLSCIALHAPVACDLRTMVAYLKIITDLERMGDLAVDVSKAVIRLGGNPYHLPLFSIPTMAQEVDKILVHAITSFKNEDVQHVGSFDSMDDVVDSLHRQNIEKIEETLESNHQYFREGIQFVKLLHAIERIGDHATNIGEWILYMKTGNIADLNT